MPTYDDVGELYAGHRRPDPRWEAVISAALAGSARVVNVGAGTGSYEPTSTVAAVEPSIGMLAARPSGAAPAVQGVAEALPFADGEFDTALAILTTHHWTDAAAGLAELQRVARRQVVVTWDPTVFARFWLVADYLPEVAELERGLATLSAVLDGLPGAVVTPMPVPWDCTDAVLGAHWRRPEAYLDRERQLASSGLMLLDPDVVGRAMARLADDLASGDWAGRHADLLQRDELDLGYRLVVAQA